MGGACEWRGHKKKLSRLKSCGACQAECKLEELDLSNKGLDDAMAVAVAEGLKVRGRAKRNRCARGWV